MSKMELKKTSIQIYSNVQEALNNASDATGQPNYKLIDMALRKFLGLKTPTIEEQLKKGKNK